MHDIAYVLAQEISQGRFCQALRHLLPAPESSYGALNSNEPLFGYFVNFLDAMLFGQEIDFLHAKKLLSYLVPQLTIPETAPIPIDPAFTKTDFCKLLGNCHRRLNFCYPLEAKPTEGFSEGATPLVFLEPCEKGVGDFLESLKGKKALFVFETKISFLNMLQCPKVVASLSEAEHHIFIMEFYPDEQFKSQPPFTFEALQPIFLAPRPLLQSYAPALISALCSQNHDWLYRVCKRALYALDEKKLGLSRACALWQKTSDLDWQDLHKTPAPKGATLGPEPADLLGRRLKELSVMRHARSKSQAKRKKLAHVVPQLVEGGHAPTRLIENLLKYHDQTSFELHLFSTERLTFHPFEYPTNFSFSPHSATRANSLIGPWQQAGIDIFIAPDFLNYEQSAKLITDLLSEKEIDIALFHGPDVINTLCAQASDVPVRALFDHGTAPTHPGYDLIISSSEDALSIYADLYKKLQITPFAVPFAVDCRASWKKEPPTKEELGLPKESFVLTTISNHLDNRLGSQMCQAICQILQRCPNAVYAPIGKVFDRARLEGIFAKAGVLTQVHLLGLKLLPSHYARACQLYLNEFPFGSGLGILDAMASGCPVVSMYDENGPQQARYGGIYFGLDRVIKSNNPEEYVALACKLIQNPTMYQEWQKAALERYEAHSDIPKYVASIEQILKKFS